MAGQLLRYELSLALHRAGRTMTVAELVAVLTASGRALGSRPTKAVSDALRWEIDHGRVVRRARGRYATGTIPPGTVRWMRHRLVLAGRWAR